jgi:peptide/nickel transport system substrate-binding protein
MRPISRRAALMASALAAPAIATFGSRSRAADGVLRVMIDGNVSTVDPVVTTESMAIQHAFMVYDQLFATDKNTVPKPQMVGAYERAADGKSWRFALRDGQRFHDGSPVESADVIASLRRWAARKPSGQALMREVEDIRAIDAKSFEIRLKRPFEVMLDVLADPLNALCIMRRADAATDPATPITTSVGSGPFIFVQEGWRPGDKAVYRRNPNYVARSEPPDGLAGAKLAKVERVEYSNIPDPTTSAQALVSGEVDMLTFPQLALLPVLRRAAGVEVRVLNGLGEQCILRVNHLVPPFNNPKARQALLYLVGGQTDYLAAIVRDRELQRPCWSVFGCGMPLESNAGVGDWAQAANADRARQLLQEAGYDGSPVVLINPPSNDRINAMSLVTAQKLRQAGVNVDLQAMDIGAWASRRNNRNDPRTDRGGWNIFHTHGKMVSQGSPLSNSAAVTSCDGSNWVGWPCDAPLQEMLEAFTTTPAEGRAALVARYQARFFEVLPYIPTGQFLLPVAYRNNLTGVLDNPGYPVVWNIEKR